MEKNKKLIIGVVSAGAVFVIALITTLILVLTHRVPKISFSLNDIDIKTYTAEDFDTFKTDYENKNLPEVYVTEFLFDGVGMYKTYDLDDFIEDGNDTKVKALSAKVFNINTVGDVEISGELTGGMIAVDTNDLKGDLNIILNSVKLDTDSKKIPAIYVYNKDITYDTYKVTIKTAEGTENYLEGGKFKKVSLVDKDSLSDYKEKYSGDAATWYADYTNYYGVYTSDEIEKILFAKVQADQEDLQDGDPYYFYKGAGAISSDVDLYFDGKGLLEVVSKNKEGIETKGSLSFIGGTGDYVISAEDDCLNTTTKATVEGAHNALLIDVKSLKAVVSLDADEGDAIDSNGTLTINGGEIIAIAKPGADAGLDSEKGTYINGGTIIATGDMFDAISSDSTQRFLGLSFSGSVQAGDVVKFINSDGTEVFSHTTDRSYTNLVYSSDKLAEGDYTLMKNDVLFGYSKTGSNNLGGQPQGMPGGEMPNGEAPTGERPEMPEGEAPNGEPPAKPEGEDQGSEPPAKPEGEVSNDDRPEMPNGEAPNGERPEMPNGEMPNGEIPGMTSAANKTFAISGISNLFSGVAAYVEE